MNALQTLESLTAVALWIGPGLALLLLAWEARSDQHRPAMRAYLAGAIVCFLMGVFVDVAMAAALYEIPCEELPWWLQWTSTRCW